MRSNILSQKLAEHDTEVANIIAHEHKRQQNCVNLIASENMTSEAVMEAQGSVFTNKYAEGYSGRRYYGGCEFTDQVENLAIERLKKLYDVNYANVQPHSGSQANQAVFLSLLPAGAKIMGLSLDCGGHLTHGSKVNFSGKLFEAVSYGVDKETEMLDYDAIREIAMREKPQLIIAGFSAYSRIIDFAEFRAIADEVGALLLADIAHISGLVAAGAVPSPVGYADVITSTTHKTLRGPRGGIIMTNDENIAKKVNSGIFPGVQGGPLVHVIAAKAVAFRDAATADFKQYIADVIAAAQAMTEVLKDAGNKIVSNGTDTHLFMVDLQKKGLTGKDVKNTLESIGIVCNQNTVPYDPQSPFVTSGIRIGTPFIISQNYTIDDAREIAGTIAEVIDAMQQHGELGEQLIMEFKGKVENIIK